MQIKARRLLRVTVSWPATQLSVRSRFPFWLISSRGQAIVAHLNFSVPSEIPCGHGKRSTGYSTWKNRKIKVKPEWWGVPIKCLFSECESWTLDSAPPCASKDARLLRSSGPARKWEDFARRLHGRPLRAARFDYAIRESRNREKEGDGERSDRITNNSHPKFQREKPFNLENHSNCRFSPADPSPVDCSNVKRRPASFSSIHYSERDAAYIH